MHYTKLQTPKKAGFHTEPVYRKAEPAAVTMLYLQQKTSFFVAAICLVAFIGGNMVGQHGWYAFWKSVMGAAEDSLIEYTGMTPPVDKVPDYSRWSAYGGNAEGNTFRQVPKDFLIPLPQYSADILTDGKKHSYVYSVGYMGSYKTGHEADGSHPGVDIRLPEGTPIRSIANGIVSRVDDDGSGFGKLIVIRHPHVPDPDSPGNTTVVFSAYAHLSAQYVAEGDVVAKGQEIGLSGSSGDATGPHLHFQIDRATAPWHPYWPFSSSEARNAGYPGTFQAVNAGVGKENGYTFTLNPLVFIATNGQAGSMIAKKPAAPAIVAASVSSRASLADLVAARRSRRNVAVSPVVVRQTIAASLETPPPAQVQASSAPSLQASSASSSASSAPKGDVAIVEVSHDGSFSGREWERVRITLKNAQGQTIQPDSLDRDLVLRTAFGDAEFRPASLSFVDFKDGEATVMMLPRGRRTVVIIVQPSGSLSEPMRFTE